MADQNSPPDEGPRPAAPARDGNPSKRQRQFNAERGAVLHVPDEGRDKEPREDEPGRHKARVDEYRRRQKGAAQPPSAPDDDGQHS